MSNITFFIHSDIFELENFSNENIKEFVKKINPILEIGRQLKAKVYYSLYDIEGLNDVFTDFKDSYIKNQKNYLAELLKDFIMNNKKTNLFKIHFSDVNTSLESFSSTYFKPTSGNHNVVFSLNCKGNLSLLLVKSNNDFEKVELNFNNCKNSIWDFINEVLPKREYNFSNKHGNDKIKAIAPNNEKASQLLCSDDQAQELLNTAIFDLNHREKFYCNFDQTFEKYILFPFEGENPQNKFHAFHLVEAEWNNKIPKSIRKYFKK